MDYEKKYKEALERANAKIETYNRLGNTSAVKSICEIFPELKESEDELKWLTEFIREEAYYLSIDIRDNEDRIKLKNLQRSLAWLEKQDEQKPTWSEDERIRKEIIEYLEQSQFGEEHYQIDDDIVRGYIAWLEKQGDQKSGDNVESKFKVGDWINGYYTSYKVLSVNNKGYVVEDVDGNTINILFENEKFHHLWTIQDAKDGDVLANNGNIILFEDISNSVREDYKYIQSHCLILAHSSDFYTGGSYNLDDGFHPATKEQRDLLFQKMHEAGYEWDFEVKELKKIEQKPAWSEEDEIAIDDALWAIQQARTIAKDENDMGNLWYAERWLNSIKERMKGGEE